MNILFVDPVCWEEHTTYNRYWIEILIKSQVKYSVILKKGYAKNIGVGLDHILWEYPGDLGKGRLIHKIKHLYRIFRSTHMRQFDYVIFSIVDKRAFFLSPFFLCSKAILVSHVWSSFSFVYTLFLRLLAFKHHLISIDHFVHQNLVARGIPNTLIVHPVPSWKAVEKKKKGDFLVYVPGRNSHYEFLETIRQDSGLDNWLERHEMLLCIRDKQPYLSSRGIHYLNEFLSKQEYLHKMQEADLILIPYDRDFVNRISNVFFEAVVLHKNILIKSPTHLDNYQMFDVAGHHIRFFSTVEELKQQLLYFKTTAEVPMRFYDSLISEFSLEKMYRQFCQLIHISQ